MQCLICDQPAPETERGVDHVDFDCEECGKYRVSGSLQGEFAAGWSLRALETREWLKTERSNGIERPVINTSNAIKERIAGVRIPNSL